MRKSLVIVLFLQSIFLWAQITLPIQQSNIPKNNLVVNYDFSKTASFTRGSGTVTNLAGTASGNGTLYNAPIFMNSLGLISFNGSNQYVATPNIRTYFKSVNTSFQKSFTMSFWFYPIASTGVLVSELDSQTPSGGWHASNIEMVNGYLKYRIWNGSIVTSTSAVNLNQWYHVAMVYDGTSVKGYLNGVLQGTQAGAREIPTTSQHYAIGAGETTNMGTSAYGKFNLAQFKIFNLPFTDFDVVKEYESRKSEFDYTIHSPITSSYWNVSSAWNASTGATGASGAFGTYAYVPWLNSSLGWVAQQNNTSQFLSLSYDEPTYIKGIVTQGRTNDYSQWVSEGHIETSLTGSDPWTRVFSNKTLNSNNTDDVLSMFPTPVFAKYVRVLPTNWNSYITMRMGLLVKPNTSITNGLVLNLDAANLKSYSSGTTWTDLSGNGNNATLLNGPTFNAGAGGQIVLDGVNDAVTTAAIPSTSGNNSRTVMAWYKSTANRNTAILDKGSVLDDGAEQLFVAYANSVGTTNAYPPTNPGGIVLAFWGNDLYYPIDSSLLFDGNWHFVAYTYDNTNSSVRICFDGSFATTVYQWNTSWTTNNSSPFVLPNSINTANNPVLIGQNRGALWGNGGLYSSAAIPYVQLYNRALTESEIVTNYNATKYRYNLVEFKTVGTTTWKVPSGVTSVDYLVVGGGGGGANGYDNAGGGGGGAGMVLSGSLSVISGSTLNITVGDGGVGGANTRFNNAGSSGNNSSFHTITALGGGGGFGSRTTATAGATQISSNSAPVGGGGSQGGNGGKGGGGSTGNGSANSGTTGGAGGSGFASDISGSSLVYGIGGAGANSGTQNGGTNGANNTGNGGVAGGAASSSSVGGGKGGSGVVILKLNFN
jgi:hypothetical protein